MFRERKFTVSKITDIPISDSESPFSATLPAAFRKRIMTDITAPHFLLMCFNRHEIFLFTHKICFPVYLFSALWEIKNNSPTLFLQS